jgi:hypothetical protein
MGRRKPHRIMWKAARKENIIARRKKKAVRLKKAAAKAKK